jgi:hypothetical protein
MNYEEIPGLGNAVIFSNDKEIAYVDGFPVPKRFTALFTFYEEAKRVKIWGLRFRIFISDNGTPVLWSIEVEGSFEPQLQDFRITQEIAMQQPDKWKPVGKQAPNKTESPITEGERLGAVSIQRWQLKVLESQRFNLLELAMRLAITTTTQVTEDGKTWWRIENKDFNAADLKKMKMSVERKLRQKITPDLLEKVAEIYTNAELAGEPPIQALQNHFNLKHRTAQEYATRARRLGLLPETSRGVVTVKKPRARKENK